MTTSRFDDTGRTFMRDSDTVTKVVIEPPPHYTPRIGDVLERGRTRLRLLVEKKGGAWGTHSMRRRWFRDWPYQWHELSYRPKHFEGAYFVQVDAYVVPQNLVRDGWRVVHREPEEAKK